MTRISSAFNLLKRVGFALLLLALVACDKDTEPEQRAPEVEYFIGSQIYAAGDTVEVAAGIEIGVGVRVLVSNPAAVRLRLAGLHGDTLLDTTVSLAEQDTLRVSPVFSAEDTTVLVHVEAEEWPAPTPLIIKPRDVSVSVMPSSGVAPLVASISVRALTAQVQSFAVDFDNDRQADTILIVDEFSPLQVQTFVFPHTFPVFDDTLKVTVHYRGHPPRQSTRALRIRSQNTPPYVIEGLPSVSGLEDWFLSDEIGEPLSLPINLNQHVGDLQSPVTFSIYDGNNGAVQASLDDSLLNLALLPDQSGQGQIRIEARDANDATTLLPLNYDIQPMTDLNISIIDVETNTPLTGIISAEGVNYEVNATQPTHIQLYPNTSTEIQAFRTTNDVPSSYMWTQAVPALEDNLNVTNIPVVTYDGIEPLSVDNFRLFNTIGRDGYIPGVGHVLASWDFANADLDTIWIAHTGTTGQTPTEAQKDTLEAQITHMYNHIPIPADKQLVIYRAQPEEPLPYDGQGSIRDGIVLANYIGAGNPSASPYVDPATGEIVEAIYNYTDLSDRGTTYQEMMSCLGFVTDVNYTTMPFLDPNDAVIHSNSGLQESSPMENKAYTIMMNTPPGLEPNSVFGTPPQQFYLPENVNYSTRR